MIFLAEITDVAQQSKDVIDVLQVLVLPVVIAIVPYVFKKTKDAKKATDEAKDASTVAGETAEKVYSTSSATLDVLSAIESSFMNIGELRGDVRDIRENMQRIKDDATHATDSFDRHVSNDKAFMEETRATENEILKQVQKNTSYVQRHQDPQDPTAAL